MRERSASEEILFSCPDAEVKVEAEVKDEAAVNDEAEVTDEAEDEDNDEGYFEEADDPMDDVPDLTPFDITVVAEPAPWARRDGKGKGKGEGKAVGSGDGQRRGGRVLLNSEGGDTAACSYL